MPTATMTSKGQTVIPKAIRDHLGIKPGDRIDFIVTDDGSVSLKPAVYDVCQLRGLLKRKGQKPVSIEEMDRVIRDRGGRLE